MPDNWRESFRQSSPATGFESSLHEELEEALLDWEMSLGQTRGLDDFVIVTSKSTGPIPIHSLGDDYMMGHRTGPSAQSEQQTPVELSPLVRWQVTQIVSGVNSRLEERLSQFENDCPGQEPVSASTKSAVRKLVTWLCSRSNTVSATVSNDGVLSIATVFSTDVRLYVEVERDGSTEAAVTREKRYACNVPGNAVTDLIPEVVLAAVGSI